MGIITVGIDLAKNVLAVHGEDESGRPGRVKPRVSRDALLSLIGSLPPSGASIPIRSDHQTKTSPLHH